MSYRRRPPATQVSRSSERRAPELGKRRVHCAVLELLLATRALLVPSITVTRDVVDSYRARFSHLRHRLSHVMTDATPLEPDLPADGRLEQLDGGLCGQTVEALIAYKRARDGSSLHDPCRSLKRRWRSARHEVVLSPQVEATNASPPRCPRQAGHRSPALCLGNWRRVSQLLAWPRSRSAIASASSSSTETSWPSSSIELAMADPTRPQPTIRTNILIPQYIWLGPMPRQL